MASAVTRFVSIFAVASLVGFLIGFISSAVGNKICAICAGNKKHESILKKKKNKHDKSIVSKKKLNSLEVLISKASIDLNISYDEFVSKDNVLTEYDGVKKEIKNLKT